MARRLPQLGRFPKPPQPNADYKTDHGLHFGLAIQDALDNWAASTVAGEEEILETPDVYVVLEATITSNPGGIKEYRATITTQPPS